MPRQSRLDAPGLLQHVMPARLNHEVQAKPFNWGPGNRTPQALPRRQRPLRDRSQKSVAPGEAWSVGIGGDRAALEKRKTVSKDDYEALKKELEEKERALADLSVELAVLRKKTNGGSWER